MSSVNRMSTAAPKRKVDDPTTSFAHKAFNKSVKLRNGDSPHNSNQTIPVNVSKAAYVEEQEALEEDEDIEAGPELPPVDADEDVNEDEEGRFFGGGVSKQEREVFDFIEQNEAGEVEEKIDGAWLKRTALNFERKINKNAELRAKFEDEPMKFVASEADLDTEIKHLSLLGEHAELYGDFVQSGCAASLTSLLSHDNTDISISVCEVIAELTDEDSGADEDQWNKLVRELVKSDLVDLLVSNLERLDEENENDRAGVYHVLSVMENLLSSSDTAAKLAKSTKLMNWLTSRVKTADLYARNGVGQNRQYAAEILAILLQSNEEARTKLANLEGLDVLLELLSTWRRKDPEKDSDEEEFAENLFDCLISTVKDSIGADKFIESEGVELCLILLKDGKFAKHGAMRTLDHASSGPKGSIISERIVDAGGIKTLFTAFMKTKKLERYHSEHLVGLFASMLRHLPAESAARIRLLAKFVEKDYEKTSKLIELRKESAAKFSLVEEEIKTEKQMFTKEEQVDMEPEWLSRRMDAGLFQLRTLDVVLAWLVAEDGGARKKVIQLMGDAGTGDLQPISASLKDQLNDVDLEDSDDSVSFKEMLETLIDCLA